MNWFLAWSWLRWSHSIQQRSQHSLSGILCLEGWLASTRYVIFLPSIESLQAPLIWRTKSFFILQAAHSLSSSSTSLNKEKFSLRIKTNWVKKAPVSIRHPQGVDGHSTFKLLTIGLPVLVGSLITCNVRIGLYTQIFIVKIVECRVSFQERKDLINSIYQKNGGKDHGYWLS